MEKRIEWKRVASSEVGLILFNQSLNPIAFDRGAARILHCPPAPNGSDDLRSCIPEGIWELIHRSESAGGLLDTARVHCGNREYLCTAYFVKTQRETLDTRMVAVHLAGL